MLPEMLESEDLYASPCVFLLSVCVTDSRPGALPSVTARVGTV